MREAFLIRFLIQWQLFEIRTCRNEKTYYTDENLSTQFSVPAA